MVAEDAVVCRLPGDRVERSSGRPTSPARSAGSRRGDLVGLDVARVQLDRAVPRSSTVFIGEEPSPPIDLAIFDADLLGQLDSRLHHSAHAASTARLYAASARQVWSVRAGVDEVIGAGVDHAKEVGLFVTS